MAAKIGTMFGFLVIIAPSASAAAGPRAESSETGGFLAWRTGEEDSSNQLLAALGSALGEEFRWDAARRAAGAQADLEPTFTALPKNAQGRLSAPAVRYLLHRALLRQRGWLVNGIQPVGGAWDASSPTEAFQDIAPTSVARVFQRHLGGRGFNLQEVAVMFAALESFVLQDAMQRVAMAYAAQGLPAGGSATAQQVKAALETYMRSYILGPKNASRMSPKIVDRLESFNMTRMYPGWQRTIDFVGSVRRTWVPDAPAALGSRQEALHPYTAVKRIVEQVGSGYGKSQDSECRSLKKQLVSLEDPMCPGRVPLDRFYGSALAGGWQFTEHEGYLRDNGVLDETNPQRPSVLVANYITNPSNCVASSSFFSLCCLDECEALLGHLESEVAGPDATPEELARLVVAMPSATQPSRAALPEPLVKRLVDIAELHGGRVPLHGRLFTQWMHNAYPRECPFPHPSSTTHPTRAIEWKRANNRSSEATREEMEAYVEATDGRLATPLAVGSHVDGQAGPICSAWTSEEELVAPITIDSPPAGWALPVAMPAAVLSMLGALTALSLAKAWRPAASGLGASLVHC